MSYRIELSRRRYRPTNKPLPKITRSCESHGHVAEVCEALAQHGGRFEKIEAFNADTKGLVMFWADEEQGA